jgi:23S rRNA (guanosine2251-2'-O)-methyltransferase
LKKEEFFIYGKHAVFSALKNDDRKIDEVICIEDNIELVKSIQIIINNKNKKIKLKYVSIKALENIIKKDVKHQGILARSHRLNIKNYSYIFDKKKSIKKNITYGVILDRLTDPNNIGAIYRSAQAFNVNFIVNSSRHSIIENGTILNSACGAFETIQTFVANNISIAIKKFISEGWWVIGLDHSADSNIYSIIKKMSPEDKVVFIFGSEGKGIRRLIKKNCNFIARIPNVPDTHSINVSNAAAIVFYEIFKMNNSILN